MKPCSKAAMDDVMQTLVWDCVLLMSKARLRKTDLAALLGASRVTVGRWVQQVEDGAPVVDLEVGGNTSARIFMNLLVVRRLLEDGLEDGSLPLPEANNGRLARQWVKKYAPDAGR